MARVIRVERLFNLGQYKNIKWVEEVTIEDDLSQEELSNVRENLVLDVYEGFARHQQFLADAVNTRFESEELLEVIKSKRSKT